ncbi:hypothetical protein KIPB_016059, partial [Kipferlia bialata]
GHSSSASEMETFSLMRQSPVRRKSLVNLSHTPDRERERGPVGVRERERAMARERLMEAGESLSLSSSTSGTLSASGSQPFSLSMPHKDRERDGVSGLVDPMSLSLPPSSLPPTPPARGPGRPSYRRRMVRPDRQPDT